MTAPTLNTTNPSAMILAYLRGIARHSQIATALLFDLADHGMSPDQWEVADKLLTAARQGTTVTLPGPSAPAAPPVPALDLSTVPAGMYGVPGGTTRLKVQIDKPEGGKWAGWTFVKDGAVYGEGARYGNQRPGGTYRGQIEAELRAIVADPVEAMAEYGRLTETCGRCGRHLEHKDSVARGIGPVCAKKLRYGIAHPELTASEVDEIFKGQVDS